MNRRFPIITLATLSLALLAQYAWAATDLSVTFVNPEKYTDASYSSMFANASDRADVQRDIEQHLQTLGERYLAPGDALKIDVLDIDLAGRVEPLRSRVGNDVRVIRDIAWPRMTVRYTLTRGGQTEHAIFIGACAELRHLFGKPRQCVPNFVAPADPAFNG